MGYCIDHLPSRLSIGRETETGVTDIRIDCTDWLERWPGMTVAAIFCPPGGTPYILDTEMSGNSLVWHVRDTDTATPGVGQLELTGEADGKRKLSALVDVQVARRLPGTAGDAPAPAQPWVDSVLGAAERITGMQVVAETLDKESSATADWDGERGVLVLGIPRGVGPQGEKGEPGKDAVVDATLTQSGQAADAKATGDAIGQLKSDMTAKADKAALTRTDRSLDALWKLNQGISYDFQTDAEEAYQKTVPSGAKLADVNSIGGHTEAIDGELVSADVESVKYNDAIIADIPASVRAIPGYGWSAGSVYNSIERTESGWQYIQRVGSVDLGTLDWIKHHSADSVFYVKISNRKENSNNILSSIYATDKSGNAPVNVPDKQISGYYGGYNVFVQDTNYTSVAALKTAMNGVMLYYELETPIITNITEDMLEPFAVEGGGTLTFTNAAQLPVPSSVEYIVSLAEVGA